MNSKDRPPSGGAEPLERWIAEQYSTALRHHQAGRLPEAERLVRQILAANPGHADSLHFLGLIAHQVGRNDIAVDLIEKAIALNDRVPAFHNSLGEGLRAVGQRQRAVVCYQRALALSPDFAAAHGNLGNTLMELGKPAEAIACYRRLLTLNPEMFPGHNNLGNALKEQGKLSEAVVCYQRALALKPDFAEAHHNLADTFQLQGRFVEAVAHYEQALALRPDFAEAHHNLGSVLQGQGKLAKAMAHYQKALAIREDFPEAHKNLGSIFHLYGDVAEALAHCERALALKPDFAEAKFALCVMQLPTLYVDEPEIGARRAAYRQHLGALCNYVGRQESLSGFVPGVGSHQPFYLAYQGYNDRELQGVYGSLVCQIMASSYPPAKLPDPPGPSEPVRIGIVSGFFREHSNWKLPIRGWLAQLDRAEFQIYGYHTGVRRDQQTEAAAALCHRFVQGPLSDDNWRQAILADGPHVLIYPEVGMDPASVRLAAQRLAPVQCNSWGHPETSGFPTLDYFLSSDLMEPADGQEHYTERLVRLPNLSVYCEPPEINPTSIRRSDLGLHPDAMIYWCGQSLFKYLPQYDEVLPRIAREIGDCQFVFIEYPSGHMVNDQFRLRLNRAFSSLGLNAENHCVILPRLDQNKFSAAAGLCDIVLDSIGWSGCNSTLEVLPNSLPIVTIAAPLMRGRHTVAILKMMGVTETITRTLDEYVAVAVRLAQDSSWRSEIRTRIRDNRHRIYGDRTCIAALEDFLKAAVRSGTAANPEHQRHA